MARDHLVRAVCGVGFLANISIFAAKTALHPIPIQAPRIHANKSALAFAALGIIGLLGAWREYASDNRRDAKLMSACGAGGLLAGAAVWLV